MQTLWQAVQQQAMVREDADLLRAFVLHKNEEAFSQLVKKHGGMVLSVCQRLLSHRQDAEDAFQATFLVLAQKAGTLHGLGPLSCWLYGVARRVAMKARTRRPRPAHRIEDHQVAAQEGSSMAFLEGAQMRPDLDDAIASLPECYRTTLVLCLLSGLTKAEAARQLGCPEGTISSRLMRAKELLREKLVKRGITLTSVALLEPMLAPCTVSASLVEHTVSLGMKVALGTTLTAGTSSSILTLAQGAAQVMYITKLKISALCLIAAAGITLGTSYVAGGWGQDSKAPVTQAPSTNVKPRPSTPVGTSPITVRPTAPLTVTTPKTTESVPVGTALNQPSEQLSLLTEQELPLDDYLKAMETSIGLPTIIDANAFRDAFADFNQQEFRLQKINLPRMKNQSVDTMLRSLLDSARIKDQNSPASYMVRRNAIVIVPQDYIIQAASKLMVAFESTTEQCTLVEALDRLSKDTGVSIILDARMMETAQSTIIRSSFRNIKLINAVKLLAGMAELNVLNIDGALYVSNSENCRKMEEELSRGQ